MDGEIFITPIPVLQDNYVWVISNKSHAIVVDPGDAEPVINYLKLNKLILSAILITHHHKDHTGGVEGLIKNFKCEVYSHPTTKLDCLKHNVAEGSSVILDGFPKFSILEIPGHTLDHIAFYFQNNLFCGDTLFSAGCGRVFEGTYAQMYRSLLKIKSLPASTYIYCAHEYTLQNLFFAKEVEPNNKFIEQKIIEVSNLQKNKNPSLPSILSDELEINPFIRCDIQVVARSAENYIGHSLKNEDEIFKVLREWKNNFVSDVNKNHI